jgi:hypothetical protein
MKAFSPYSSVIAHKRKVGSWNRSVAFSYRTVGRARLSYEEMDG